MTLRSTTIATHAGLAGAFLILAVITSGCISSSSSGRVDFDADDQGVTMPEFRARIPGDVLLGATDAGLLGNFRGTQSLDVYFTTFDGRTSEGLDASEFLLLDGVQFAGPQIVRADYDVQLGSLDYTFGWSEQYISGEVFVGLGFLNLEVDYESATGVARDHIETMGIHTGIRGRADLTGRLGISAEIAVTRSGTATASTAAAMLLVSPAPQVDLYAGWRWWDIEAGRSSSSDLDLDIDGPVIGVIFNF